MIKSLIGFACAGVLFVAIANAQVSTVTGTESTGKITDYTPDSALVLDTGQVSQFITSSPRKLLM